MNNDFKLFNLKPGLVQAVTERGYKSPTPIQTQVIPSMMAGNDVTGQAQTGTGKTAAFALPMLHNLVDNWNQVQGLVVTPTRELALQVAETINAYGHIQKVRVLAVYGGSPYGPQIRQLKSGVDVVVGTPGRLLDLIKKKALDLSSTHMVVLDEADEMLSMGFVEDIEALLKATPDNRQTALFSATMPAPIRRLADKYLNDPLSITIEHKKHNVESIEQRYYLLNAADKFAALTRLFEVEPITQVLIFSKTRRGSDELANKLAGQGYSVEALNGDLSQDARERVMKRFRKDQIKILVATDVAARGLDIDDISHVINYDLPYDVESYVHRIGRTGRAGKDGIAISLVTPSEQFRLNRIEKFTQHPIKEASLPTEAEIFLHREEILVQQIQKWLQRDRCRREQEIVEEMVLDGYDPVKVAAVALKLARAEEKQRPIAKISEISTRSSGKRKGSRDMRRSVKKGKMGRKADPKSKVSHEDGMIRLSLGTGKNSGARPSDIVGAIASWADIPGYSIGKIFIQQKHTLVDIPEEYSDKVLSKSGSYKVRKQENVTVERF
jgi:ATP-dependent RNA helicase DeaD